MGHLPHLPHLLPTPAMPSAEQVVGTVTREAAVVGTVAATVGSSIGNLLLESFNIEF